MLCGIIFFFANNYDIYGAIEDLIFACIFLYVYQGFMLKYLSPPKPG